jgi:hypothetical protein
MGWSGETILIATFATENCHQCKSLSFAVFKGFKIDPKNRFFLTLVALNLMF